MDRNLFRRIEVAFPVEAAELQARVAEDLNLYLQDDTQAWVLSASGRYARAEGAAQVSAQALLLSLYDERVALVGCLANRSRRGELAGRAHSLRRGPQPPASDGVETKARFLQVNPLLLQILERERMILHPSRRQLQGDGAAP